MMYHRLQKNLNALVAANLTKDPLTEESIITFLNNVSTVPGIPDMFKEHMMRTIAMQYPVFTGATIVHGIVTGGVWLHNVIQHAGLIFGCGAILLEETADIPDGSIVFLPGGRIINTIEEANRHIVANMNNFEDIRLNN
jgi:hypothetical protein